ncbi:hypothetical protein PAMC26510_25725 [Caballeronia sordidicola]|uniref:Uncharacterized protein n=1 Tax=Caballeronia sordidicola TaxID=196367 RepID=A0A242MGT3_CABSO|nr:hypothetical protein PAMC26510_25725 [Caballeronia sordidicola]
MPTLATRWATARKGYIEAAPSGQGTTALPWRNSKDKA